MYDGLPPRGADAEYLRGTKRVSRPGRLALLGLISAAALLILWPTPAGARPARPSAFCVLDGLGILHPATACRRPFSRTSPFNRRVRRHPKVAANSAHIVKRAVGSRTLATCDAGDA